LVDLFELSTFSLFSQKRLPAAVFGCD